MCRLAARTRYQRSEILRILDSWLIAHVGVSTPDGPLVLPIAYGRDDDQLYLHGAVGNHLLRTSDGGEICVTVTHLDGLVMARTPFHSSMNYRSVVVRESARRIVDPERKLRALRVITDHVVANWDNTRLPSASDLRSTLVLELPLAEASAKIRSGDPVDEPEDLAGPWWAGVVPISIRFEPAIPSSDLTGDIELPASIQALSWLTPDERSGAPR